MDPRLGGDTVKPAANRERPQVDLGLVDGRGKQDDVPVDVEDLAYLKVIGVTGSPSTISRRAAPRSQAQISAPEAVYLGTPATRVIQILSVSRNRTDAWPVPGSTARTSSRRWSRLCTAISGPWPSQVTAVRYSNSP